MKICIISNLYPPYARGGAEQVVYKIAQELSLLGHQMSIITLSPEQEEKVVEGNITIYRIHPANFFFYTDAHKHSFFLRLLWHIVDIFHVGSRQKIKSILQAESPDVVHTHNLMGIGFLVPHLIQKLGLRHIHTVHDVQLVEPSGIILKTNEKNWRYTGLPIKLYTVIIRTLFGSPSVVISPSQFLMQFYEERGFFKKSRRIVMRNPITLPADTGTERKKEVFTFLYVGQIEEHKGVHFLVQTFLNYLQTSPHSELHIVGSGSYLNELQIQCKMQPNIIFHGKVARERLPELFGSADITIVPSLCYENSPTVIFESLSFGVPVLASNIEGIAELIREGENGLTFNAGDQDALQSKLTWCRDHRRELQTMGQKGKHSLHDLSKENYTEKLIQIYTEK